MEYTAAVSKNRDGVQKWISKWSELFSNDLSLGVVNVSIFVEFEVQEWEENGKYYSGGCVTRLGRLNASGATVVRRFKERRCRVSILRTCIQISTGG